MKDQQWKVFYQNEEDPEAYRDRGNTAVHLDTYRLVAQFDWSGYDPTPGVRDRLWAMLNIGSTDCIIPGWLCLRSLSVNDIVQDLDGTLYLCAEAGWREVENSQE